MDDRGQGTRRDEISAIVERIILRRYDQRRIGGYTMEMANEIVAALSSQSVGQGTTGSDDWLQFMLEVRDFLQDISTGATITEASRDHATEFVAMLDVNYNSLWHKGSSQPRECGEGYWSDPKTFEEAPRSPPLNSTKRQKVADEDLQGLQQTEENTQESDCDGQRLARINNDNERL